MAHDIDSFFELFTEIMTSGPAFVALPPEKQRCGSCGAAVVVLIIAQ